MMREPIRKVRLTSGDIRYRVRVDRGLTPAGRRRQQMSTFGTLREARQHLAKLRAGVVDGSVATPTDQTVRAYLESWLDRKRGLRATTKRSYMDALKPVVAHLGDRRLQSLVRTDLDLLVEQLLHSGGRNQEGWSPRTVHLTLTVLSQALNDAVREEVLERNVASLVRRPRLDSKTAQTWTPAEVGRFVETARSQRLYAAWLLSLMGLRRGEVLGLRWQDVDLESAQPAITVSQTRVVAQSGRVIVSLPKTRRSRRELPLGTEASVALAGLRDRQRQESALVMALPDYVVADELGHPLHPDTYSSEFQRLAAAAGLHRIRLHDLRHTALTLMTLQGVPLPVVAAWAGHADAAFTLRTYAHSQPSALLAASEALTVNWRAASGASGATSVHLSAFETQLEEGENAHPGL